MDIFISRGAQDPEVRIPFPAEPDIVWPMLRELDEYCASNDPFRIAGTSALVPNLTQYISCADVEDAADIRKLNELAELVDGMSTEEQRIFAGALDAESVNGLDDVLRIASNLGQYEFIEGVTSDKELGGWLVEHGQAGVEFPEAVRPYLDYAGIGGAYYASHGGAYTPNGYVKRRMVEQEQAVEPKSKFSLTLTSSIGTVRLNLPAFQDDLEQAKRVLDLDSLDSAAIVDVEIGYPWADLLDMDSITLHDAHILAKCVREMTDRELKVFGAVLEIEAPNSFSDANITAMYLDDHELVDLISGVLLVRDSKNGNNRYIPMSAHLTDRCRDYAEQVHGSGSQSKYFFPAPDGGMISEINIYTNFRRFLHKAGISHGGKGKGPRIYDFRHTFAVHSLKHMVRSGKDMSVYHQALKTYMGHSFFKYTAYYLQLTKDMFPDIRAKIEAHYNMIMGIGGVEHG